MRSLISVPKTIHPILRNGGSNTFYMIAQDQKSTNQNSGVHFDAATERGKDSYYGYIMDIWEHDYGHDFRVPLFK